MAKWEERAESIHFSVIPAKAGIRKVFTADGDDERRIKADEIRG
jgi:hypothetical protein